MDEIFHNAPLSSPIYLAFLGCNTSTTSALKKPTGFSTFGIIPSHSQKSWTKFSKMHLFQAPFIWLSWVPKVMDEIFQNASLSSPIYLAFLGCNTSFCLMFNSAGDCYLQITEFSSFDVFEQRPYHKKSIILRMVSVHNSCIAVIEMTKLQQCFKFE
ncbi:hypothetical protein T07_12357 [Trichinella nelsoni]|uniref:Uncharacterized protein n=1 Tax=Trichinella nelsoni TaxID=6336 RepID=A0A0V0SMV0_9BILA|nr:hypothetical protein T07_12357 [Trichinella nelsoni]